MGDLQWHPVYTGLLLLGLLGIPLLPGVFNLLMARLARRIPAIDAYQMPRMRARTLIEGMAITSVGWVLLGGSLWTALVAVVPDASFLTPALGCQLIGIIGLSYVAGFLILVVPGGIGVREYFLLNLLVFAGPETWIALAVLLLRAAWTAAELVAAAGFQLLQTIKPRGEVLRTPRVTSHSQ